MSEEDKQLFNKMIYCNLINGEQALKFKRKYEDLQQKVEQLENIRKEAIEYINDNFNQMCEYSNKEHRYISCDKVLLNILNKGSE